MGCLFSGTKWKDSERQKDNVGLNNATAAILPLDHFSPKLEGDTRISKVSPLEWVQDFLPTHAPRTELHCCII